MSKDIFETNELQVTAYVGPYGAHHVQISCKGDHEYAQLDNDQTLELAYALISRILCKDGYRATD